MWKKIAIAGAVTAAVLGTGGAALAESGSAGSVQLAVPTSTSAPAPTQTHTGTAAKAGRGRLGVLRRALHGEWVTKKGTGTVTHEAIRGSVTAVSATSVTVKAADNVSMTFSVTSATKIHVRAAGKGTTGTIAQVKSGAKVFVLGTGTTSLTATQILVPKA